jgi:hypothetical protein
MAEADPEPLATAIADDISINTVHIENRVIKNAGGAEEYVIKFVFLPKNNATNPTVANTHYSILASIKQFFPDTKIYDNFGSEMKTFTLKSYDEYLRHFKLEFVKGNEDKRRGPIYMVHHRIISTVSLGEIRRHWTVADLLKRVNTRVTKHLWNEQDTRIATLGFFTDVDPTNFLKTEYEALILKQIAERTKKNKKNIPRFQCTFSSPYDVHPDDNTRISTKTYAVKELNNTACFHLFPPEYLPHLPSSLIKFWMLSGKPSRIINWIQLKSRPALAEPDVASLLVMIWRRQP